MWLAAGPIPGTSSRTTPREKNWSRTAEYCDVGPHAPITDVVTLEAHNLFEVRDLVPAVYLPRTGNARNDDEPHKVVRFVMRELGRHAGPRSDKAHFAPEHIPELRQFVQ